MPRRRYIKKEVIMSKKGEGIDSLISYDIPIHRHMEGQKQELESLYRDMVELSADSIFTVDTKGVIKSCNSAAMKMLGYSRDELVGKHFAKLGALRLKDIPRYLKIFKDVLGGEVGEPIEVAIHRKDKTLFISDVRVNLLKMGDKTVLQAAVRDITERKRMESEIQAKNEQLDAQNEELRSANEELQATEEELRTANEELQASNEELQTTLNKLKEANTYSEGLLKSMVDGLSVLDLEGRVIDINDALQGMLGLKREEVLGQSMVQLLGPMVEPAEIEKVSATIGQLMAGAPARSIEVVIATKYGTSVTLSIAPSVVRDDKDQPIMLFAVVRDITERKRMESEIQAKNEQLDAQNEELRSANEELQATEEELRAANEELQSANDELRETQEKLIRSEKLAAIGQLASGVGHELRNPLGAIKNAVFYVRRRIGNTDLPATEPRVMEFLDIIDEEVNAANKVITDLLGFSRVAKPTVSPISIAGVIEDALKHNPLPENIQLASVIDENLPMVMVDADQVRQVFINIVLNALQAMPDGGRLGIRARSKGEFVEVEFSDNGSGIPTSAIKKIFDPLFTTKAKGIGLGLSVCKSILERHGGDIWVESKVGSGSTFTVSLPTR
jgi:PAS domain S-box-containing protein